MFKYSSQSDILLKPPRAAFVSGATSQRRHDGDMQRARSESEVRAACHSAEMPSLTPPLAEITNV